MTQIIGFTGLKGSGKTTIAQATGYPVVSFADPLKQACKAIFGLEDRHLHDRALKEVPGPLGISYRRGAQLLGVWVRDTFGEDFWVRHAERRIERLDAEIVVIDDVRFSNEAEWCDVVVGIVRPGVVLDDEHISETEMLDKWDQMTDYILKNHGSVEDAIQCLRKEGIL